MINWMFNFIERCPRKRPLTSNSPDQPSEDENAAAIDCNEFLHEIQSYGQDSDRRNNTGIKLAGIPLREAEVSDCSGQMRIIGTFSIPS
jgi:hypothetical protein